MKKDMLLMLLILCVPMAFAGTFSDSDFYRPYLQSKYEFPDAVSLDSYLLRGTSQDTNINTLSPNFASCELATYGSEHPFSIVGYVDPVQSYEHYAVISTKTTKVRMITTDCSILDTYTLADGQILTGTGVLNGGNDADGFYPPLFAFVYNKTSVDEIHLKILTLDTNSQFTEFKDIKVGTNLDGFSGLPNMKSFSTPSGGCLDSDTNSCNYNNKTIGFYYLEGDVFITYSGHDDWQEHNITLTGSYIEYVSNNGAVFFDDYEADGKNEWLLYGMTPAFYSINLQRILPLTYAPYVFNKPALTSSTFLGLNHGNYYGEDYFQAITPCQLGSQGSVLETCFSLIFGTTTKHPLTGIISNSFANRVYTTIATGEYYYRPPFTIDFDDDGLFDGCFVSQGGYNYSCYDKNLNLLGYYNFSDTLYDSSPIEIFVTESDNVSASREMIFSNGTIYRLYNNSNVTKMNKLHPYGNTLDAIIMVEDINDDKYSEIIYQDRDYLTIWSQDDTPWVAQSFTPYSVTTTTTLYTPTSSVDTPTEFVEMLNDNIFFIIAMLVIVGIVVFVAQYTQSPIILLFVGFVATILSYVLGLISVSVILVFVGIFALLLLLSFTLFRSKE